jgi:hypothetical protein
VTVFVEEELAPQFGLLMNFVMRTESIEESKLVNLDMGGDDYSNESSISWSNNN